MITINVDLEVLESQRKSYLDFVDDLVKKSKDDTGCLFYEHFENVSKSNHFMIIENWENQQALDLHNETSHLKQFVQEIGEYLTKAPVIKISHD